MSMSGFHCLLHMGLIVFIFILCGIFYVHRIHSTGNLNNRSIIECPGEFFRIDVGGSNDESEILSTFDQSFQDPQQEIDIQAALMRFINDKGVILIQIRVRLGFGKQHAVCHDFDVGR